MKKTLIGVGAFAVAAGYLLSQYWYYLPGIISDIVAPVGENQTVVWEQGPTQPPPAGGAAAQPPNVVLIVVDDLGFNDITFYGGGIGNGSVPTPQIDAIAKGLARCDSHHPLQHRSTGRHRRPFWCL